ncbi:MAG: GAF domain-containing sensor histidine kinase [Anaerolineae bacterium]|nr:GAF domain-containing sensor histidine kinase [Anaerolineae bacterium]
MAETETGLSRRQEQYLEALRRLQRGDFAGATLSVSPNGEVDPLGQALATLAHTLAGRARETERFDRLIQRVNAGLLLDEILDSVYDDFRDLIPYDRLGLALLDPDDQMVCARYAKMDDGPIHLRRGYAAPLAGSSLQTIIETGQPRILNDLPEYLRQKPESESTRLIVAEGMRASLTCPLIADGVPVGFLFFSSTRAGAYHLAHVETFMRVAGHLSVIVERGRLASELAAQKHAVERQNRELSQLNEHKNLFLGIATHDLRNPLSLFEMATGLLLDPNADISDDEHLILLRDMKHQARHMLRLIDELLDVTAIESGHLRLEPIPVVLGPFLTEVVERHQQMARPKGTQVILSLDGEDGAVRADPVRLRQVLDNLISNAVKFSPPGSIIQVSAAREASAWRISITDQGPGILPEERSQLFQAFARLSALPTGGERSTGLGLAITRRVVEAHGGKIGVESEPGQGATFWFTLPD